MQLPKKFKKNFLLSVDSDFFVIYLAKLVFMTENGIKINKKKLDI